MDLNLNLNLLTLNEESEPIFTVIIGKLEDD